MAETKESTENATHLEVVDRVKNIPVIQSAIENAGSTYSYLKDSHHVINWALTQAEAGLQYATATAIPLIASWTKRYEGPITTVDQKLCEGLNVLEQKLPLMKQPPQEIYDAAVAVMNNSLELTIDKFDKLKEISTAKANELLATEYGSMTVQGVDNTSVLINNLLDLYFPPVEGEENTPAPVSADENRVLYTIQTISQLSTKTANRVYYSVVAQLQTLKEEDIVRYMTNFSSILVILSHLYSKKT